MKVRAVLALSLALVACGDDDSGSGPDARPADECATPPAAPAVGDDGHPQPLGSGPTEARAGRVHTVDLPTVASGLATWANNDFVLANDKIAMVIEDVGASDLYDPWGGRPVGMARVAGGKMVEPADFGEVLLLTGRSTVVTGSVSVIADGSDGGPAIVRAAGKLAPLPFFDNLTLVLFGDGLENVDAAIDYVLRPGAEKVEIVWQLSSPRLGPIDLPLTMHGFMFTKRTPAFTPDGGFTDTPRNSDYLALIDDDGASWAYLAADGPLGSGISASGFVSGFTQVEYTVPACAAIERPHASIVIGGPGLDGLRAAVARDTGVAQRAITATVTRGGAPAAGVKVHAVAGASYLTRAISDAQGQVTLHVPPATAVELIASRLGDRLVRVDVAAEATTAAIALPALGAIHVIATGADDLGLPARVQILPANGGVERLPGNYGDVDVANGRLHVAYPATGDVTLPVPPGRWRVVISRGYEYEIEERTVDVVANATVDVEATLDRVVDTVGVQCADFHIHTARSNDSNDDGRTKLASAVADGLELPVRSDHEWVDDFRAEISQLGVGRWAAGFGSIEMTSMELWGHMGVFPLSPDPSKVNQGAPLWQSFPTVDEPDVTLTTLSPRTVFDQVRARPEKPIVIINHPRGGSNYFTYVGLDAATGIPLHEADWDNVFTTVEVFNDSGWKANLDGTVRDWFTLLRTGRKVFAVGSSDTHGITSSPVGYPRTCLNLGTDVPGELTANKVRDVVAAGHSLISGGIYLYATVGELGPGDTVPSGSSQLDVHLKVQAASWIDVDAIDVVVDGQVVDTIPVMPGSDPVVRFDDDIRVTVGPGSFVVLAAYGDRALDPVHPGRIPFGVTNPIFVGN